jgi:hypothetical protein
MIHAIVGWTLLTVLAFWTPVAFVAYFWTPVAFVAYVLTS